MRYEDRATRNSDGDAMRSTQGVLVFKDGKEMKFGSNCPPDRLQFLVAGAKTTLRSLLGKGLVGAKDTAGDKLDSEVGAGVVTVTVGALVFTEDNSVDSTVGVTVYSISMTVGVNVFRLTCGLGVGSYVDKITSPQ